MRDLGEPARVRIDVLVEIDPSGAVAEVNVTGPEVEDLVPCVEAAVRQWRFPTSSGATRTNIPFIFHGDE